MIATPKNKLSIVLANALKTTRHSSCFLAIQSACLPSWIWQVKQTIRTQSANNITSQILENFWSTKEAFTSAIWTKQNSKRNDTPGHMASPRLFLATSADRHKSHLFPLPQTIL